MKKRKKERKKERRKKLTLLGALLFKIRARFEFCLFEWKDIGKKLQTLYAVRIPNSLQH
jgi:hypothetical protein